MRREVKDERGEPGQVESVKSLFVKRFNKCCYQYYEINS